MEKIYFIASHRYDIIQFFLIKNELIGYKFNFIILVTEDLLSINILKKFVEEVFDELIPIPLYKKTDNKFIKFFKILNLRLWYRNNFKNIRRIIINDKSSPLSRFFIKRNKNIILIQPVEDIINDLVIDFKETIYDYVRCLFYDAVLLKHYKFNNSKNHTRFKELYKKDKPNNILVNTNKKNIINSFYLPKIKLKKKENKIVIFGTRFQDWRIFKERKKMLEWISEVYSIYKLISDKYSSTHECIYLPHPLEKGNEYKKLKSIFNERLIMKTDYFSSEHFLISNKGIDCTFSICSTSSRSAYDFGFDSKVIYKMLPTFENTLESVFYNMPKNFFPTNNEELFKKSIRTYPSNTYNLRKVIF